MASLFQKYKTKATREVEAVQVTAENINDLAKELRGRVDVVPPLNQQVLKIPTIMGNITATLGDYVLYYPDTGAVLVKTQEGFESEWEKK